MLYQHDPTDKFFLLETTRTAYPTITSQEKDGDSTKQTSKKEDQDAQTEELSLLVLRSRDGTSPRKMERVTTSFPRFVSNSVSKPRVD